jgi:regulator of sigma E protease
MDFLTGIGSFGSSVGFYLIPFLFVLTLVVFVHEMGHFLVARLCGVKVDAFSIGFGREIVGWTDRKGTRWKIGWLPLGGYVKFRGDENAASVPDREELERVPLSQREGLFHFMSVERRAAVVAAGPLANFILATVIFAGLFMFMGKMVASTVVNEVTAGSVAEAAGFKAGDRILAIDGSSIDTFEDMQRIVGASGDLELAFTVARSNSQIEIIATPRNQEIKDRFGNTHRIPMLGLKSSDLEQVSYGPLTSIVMGAQECWFIVARTVGYIGGMVSGREDPTQLGGPLRIAEVSGQVATLGFAALLKLAAFLSVSIGFLNLLPVPLLDGGHLLYYAVEKVQGRPMSQKKQEFGFRVGLALVLMLMLFSSWNDVVGRPVSFLRGLFS